MRITFKIPGECRGKMRPKATSFGGHAKVYTPAKQVEYENWVRLCFQEAYPDFVPIKEGVPVSVAIGVFMKTPKSFSKKKTADALAARICPLKKPDLDNAVKSILDALNGIAFHDDSQVVMIASCKKFATDSYAMVQILELGQDD